MSLPTLLLKADRDPRPMNYLALLVAIIAEVLATTALTRSEGLSRLMPSLGALVGYLTAFGLLSITLKSLPTGIVYATWSGVGIVLIALTSWIWLKQSLDAAALIGLGLIVAGVIVVNVFSKSVIH